MEYEEQINNHWHPDIANNVTRSLTEISNSLLITVNFRLNLITADEDDNKFVDCAFAANADFIVTNDRHFNQLKEIGFPLIPGVSIKEFDELLRDRGLL